MKNLLFFIALIVVGYSATGQTTTVSPNFNRNTLQQAMKQNGSTQSVSPQTTAATTNTSSQVNTTPLIDRFFFGGNFGLNFSGDGNGGNYVEIQVAPLVGFRITPDFSVGAQIAYDYFSSSSNYYGDYRSNGFGGGLFARYQAPFAFLQTWNSGIYVHAEYDYMHYIVKYKNDIYSNSTTDRSELLLGAGIYIPMGGRTRLSVTALWDVLHLDDSEAAIPSIRIGFEF